MLKVPLTERDGDGVVIWSQREYVESMKRNIGFTYRKSPVRYQSDFFYYYDRQNDLITSYRVNDGKVETRSNKGVLDWPGTVNKIHSTISKGE